MFQNNVAIPLSSYICYIDEVMKEDFNIKVE